MKTMELISCAFNAVTKQLICAIVFSYEPRHKKTGFFTCENKDADQLRGNREADQRLCFRYTDSKYLYFINPKF